MAAGGDVPHDLATFVIEAELGIERGFWGCVAAGATFKSLGRKRTEPGRSVIRRNVAELDAAEMLVNEAYFAWRRGEATSVGPALDAALDEWRALPEGGAMVKEWTSAANPAVGRRGARRTRAGR